MHSRGVPGAPWCSCGNVEAPLLLGSSPARLSPTEMDPAPPRVSIALRSCRSRRRLPEQGLDGSPLDSRPCKWDATAEECRPARFSCANRQQLRARLATALPLSVRSVSSLSHPEQPPIMDYRLVPPEPRSLIMNPVTQLFVRLRGSWEGDFCVDKALILIMTNGFSRIQHYSYS